MWFIGVEVEQETSAPPPKKNPGAAPVTAAWRANPKSKKGDNLTILKKKNRNVTFGETG